MSPGILFRPGTIQMNFRFRVKLPTPITLTPASPDLREQIAGIPSASGVYLLVSGASAPHLGSTAHLPRRLNRLLLSSPAAGSGALEAWRERIARVDCWLAGSRLERWLLMYRLARVHHPDDYSKRLRLRAPWFVRLIDTDRFARIEVTNRLSRAGDAVGPFRTRDLADAYAQQVLQLFQIRRCTDVLTPHPDHPGCIYGEMNQCLRPCQCAVTADEYATEAARVSDFVATNGKSALTTLSVARDRASTQMDFEQASQLHKRIEKVNSAISLRDPVIGNAQEFSGVALTQGIEALQFWLWPMCAGLWQDGVSLDFSAEDPEAQSLDRQIRERLMDSLSAPRTSGRRVEELAIFSRWYYSTWRDGQWFPFHTLADLNYRKIVRQISKMAKPPTC